MTLLVENGAAIGTDDRPRVSGIRFPLGPQEIMRLLPHRWPFLLVDQVLEVTPDGKGRGLKNVTMAEPHFVGHFPGDPIMPGVLIVESMAQLAGITAGLSMSGALGPGERQAAPTRNYLACVKRMRFLRPVRPGDQLELSAARASSTARAVEFNVKAKVAGRIAAGGQLILAI